MKIDEALHRAAVQLNAQLIQGGFSVHCNCVECDALRPIHQAYEKVKEARYLLLGSRAQAPSAAQESPEAVGEGEGTPKDSHHS